MKRRVLVVFLLILATLLAGCSEKKPADFGTPQHEARKAYAKLLSDAKKEGNINEVLKLLFSYDDSDSNYRIWGSGLAISEDFSVWMKSKFKLLQPSRSAGYYDDVSKRRENSTHSSDGIVSKTTYSYFGDFEVQERSSYDTVVKMPTRNYSYRINLCGLGIHNTSYETDASHSYVLEYFLTNSRIKYYTYENYNGIYFIEPNDNEFYEEYDMNIYWYPNEGEREFKQVYTNSPNRQNKIKILTDNGREPWHETLVIIN